MAGLSEAGQNAAADAVAALGDYVSLHSADPGSTGASELAGSGYARQACTWDSADDGEAALAAEEEFDVPAGTVAYFGVWTESTGGTFLGGGALSASEVFTGAGTYRLTGATITVT